MIKKNRVIGGKYEVIKKLGQGSFGKVKLARDLNDWNKLYAIKLFFNPGPERIEKIKKEFELSELASSENHPNVLKVYEFVGKESYVKKKDGKISVAYIVMEAAHLHNFMGYIRRKKPLSDEIAKTSFLDILNGLNHIHKLEIIHLDLKPDNILMGENNQLKLADFGLSEKQFINLRKLAGTVGFLAPEIQDVISFEKSLEPYKGEKVDIFACGVIFFMMITGCLPFSSANSKAQGKYSKIHQGKYKEYFDIFEVYRNKKFDEDFKNLFLQMVDSDPQKRPTINNILEHKWMKKIKQATREEFVQFFDIKPIHTIAREEFGHQKSSDLKSDYEMWFELYQENYIMEKIPYEVDDNYPISALFDIVIEKSPEFVFASLFFYKNIYSKKSIEYVENESYKHKMKIMVSADGKNEDHEEISMKMIIEVFKLKDGKSILNARQKEGNEMLCEEIFLDLIKFLEEIIE